MTAKTTRTVKIVRTANGWVAKDAKTGRILAWDTALCFVEWAIRDMGYTVVR